MISIVLEAFANVVSVVRERDAARIKRLEDAFLEANSNIPPTIDRHGRFHAPVDGYVLPEMFVDYMKNYDDVIFAAGQYLPIPLTGDDYFDHFRFEKARQLDAKYQAREKIKVETSLADKVIGELKDNAYITFGKGQSWEVNNVSVCYLYMSSPNKSFLDMFFKVIKDAIENTETQQYTGDALVGRIGCVFL